MDLKHIIFDFDGVLAETNEIRFWGFHEVLRNYPAEQLAALDRWSRINGGLSRHVKLRYFFSNIRGEECGYAQLERLVLQYGAVVKQKVVEAPVVKGSMEFLAANRGKYDYAIVSGSDEVELRDVCRLRGIAKYFKSILGAPRSKTENIRLLLSEQGWDSSDCVFVGDAINDYDAAVETEIFFIGRDSGLEDWSLKNVPEIGDLSELGGVLP